MTALLEYLFDIIGLLIVARLIGLAIRYLFGASPLRFTFRAHATPESDSRKTVRGETARDPVCGMFVSTDLSHRLEWRGRTLHFCSRECLERYKKNANA